MCMIALQPAGVQLSGNKFRNAWARNKDGGGYAYPLDDGIVIKKGYFKPDVMLEDYRADVKAHPDVPFLIHFRISTSGALDEINTHPHRVRPDLVIAHNGHISGYGSKEQSDTLEFVNLILKKLPEAWEEDPIQTHLIERYINRDKMVILRADGEYVILNEELGYWKDKLWFSNKTYEKLGVVKHSAGSGQRPKGYVPPANQYIACGWDEFDMCDYPALDTVETFLDEQCAYCDGKLDTKDAEFCVQLDAWYPVCSDCVIENEVELVNEGCVADAVEEAWDYVFDGQEDKLPVTSSLMRWTSNVFNS